MWTLVIVVLIGTPQNTGSPTGHDRGGASSSITTIDFPDETKCNAAASTMAQGDTQVGNPGVPSAAWAAVYNIVAKCVAR